MDKVVISCSFWGKNFSPKLCEKRTNIIFSKKNEVGEIGLRGKYKNKPYDFGSAEIIVSEELEEGNYHKQIFWLLNIIKQNNKLSEFGVESIELWLEFYYSTQCNLEFTPQILKEISDLDLAFCISCYQETEEK